MFIRKLAFSNFAVRKSRVALTVAAVALSVSLVVAVTSGYASLFEAAVDYLNQNMGSADARISRGNDADGVPWTLVEEMRKDPAVLHVDPRLIAPLDVPNHAAGAIPDAYQKVQLIGVERPGDHRVSRLVLEGGTWFSSSTEKTCVIDQTVAEIMQVKVGDFITLPFLDKKLIVKVVGIIHKPAVATAFIKTIYLPLRTLQEFMNRTSMVTSLMVDLQPKADAGLFEKRWKGKFDALKPPIQMQMASEIRGKLEENLEGVRLLSYLGGAVSMLAAMFIIFSALSMGVTERQRSLAMLRAVGAFKGQVGRLVIFEGAVLATIGLLIGIPLGWIWIKVLSMIFSDIFSAGAFISRGGLLFGAAGTLGTALAASLLPAWRATRVRPLEAMAPLSHARGDGPPIGWAVAGALLISIDPVLFFGPTQQLAALFGASNPELVARVAKFYIHFALGLPGLFIGFFLLAPMCVWVVERVAGPLVARAFGLRFALLRQQLTTGIWRTAGTCTALMVGLAVLIVMQVSGHSLLEGWKLPDKFPDLFVGIPFSLDAKQTAELAQVPGLLEITPIHIASVKLGGGNPFNVWGALAANSTMFIGIDPNKAFRMMDLDFRAGNVKDATEKLKQGGWVIVTEEYRQLNHCKIGDPIILGDHTFHIAGIVWSPGIDVMKGMYDMVDQFEQRTISCVFGTIEDGTKYFGSKPYVIAAQVQPGVDRAEITKRVITQVHALGLRIGDVREVKRKIEIGFYRLLHMLSTVAFAALAVASLGVANTVMAGVRTRRWQFGILRSIGVTRDQLLRLVLAEAVLLGLIASALGLGAGFEMSVDASALTLVMVGYHPPFVVPWLFVLIGVASVLFISVGASIWPAIDVARTDPLTLLQAGRSST